MFTYPPSANARVPLVGLDLDEAQPGLLLNKVIALDIDGVLHPDGCDPSMYFCYARNLLETIECVDQALRLPIVLTSAWRFTSTLRELKDHLPPELRRLVVGVTPDLDTLWMSRPGHNRQTEIEAWMDQFAPGGQWLAIDDRRELFNDDCRNLFLVPSYRMGVGAGLNTTVCIDLERVLREFP